MLDFGVGYMAGNQRICFREKDQIGPQLLRLAKNGSQLWCEGLNPHSLKPRKRHAGSASIVIEDSSTSDDDNDRPAKAHKKKNRSALDEKAERVQSLADKLQAKHGDTFNKIQYRLWAEALDVKKHDSMEHPPLGTIWGGAPKETRRTSVVQATSEATSEAFTSMATSLASAFGQGKSAPSTPVADRRKSVAAEVGGSIPRLAGRSAREVFWSA